MRDQLVIFSASPGCGTSGAHGSHTDTVSYSYVWQTTEYIWGQQYVNDLVARDVDTNLDWGDGAEDRVYAHHDANFNTTTIADPDGAVDQRYVYDPYGASTVLSAAFGSATDAYDLPYLFQGGRQDGITGLYNFQRRDYSFSVARWQEQDATRYTDDANLYQYLNSQPIDSVDPKGTNRYYIGTGHWAIAVDIWKQDQNGTYRAVGQKQFSFSAPHNPLFIAGLIAIRGEVRTQNYADDLDHPIVSTPQQDQKLLQYLDYTEAHPPLYTLLFGYTCLEYTNTMMRVGM